MQFGFRRKHSTNMCTMVLKETLTYYNNDGGVAFCTLLDATKAFDHVEYCKLFRELLKRDLPALYLRLILNRLCTLTMLLMCYGMVWPTDPSLSTMVLDKAALLVPSWFALTVA